MAFALLDLFGGKPVHASCMGVVGVCAGSTGNNAKDYRGHSTHKGGATGHTDTDGASASDVEDVLVRHTRNVSFREVRASDTSHDWFMRE